jgi:HAD superfamily hydrolase (TIGR01549 family)
MQYKAIFIDIDDTILDYVPCCREAFDAAIGELRIKNYELRIPQSEDGLFDLFFDISGRLFSEAKRGLHTIAEVMDLYPAEFCERAGYPPEAVDPFKHAFRKHWGLTHVLVPEARETMEALRNKGYRLFAASNSFGHLQRSRLQQAGILHLFEDTYISMDIGYDKPDVRFYEEALRRCGLQPQDVLMVGDSMTTDIVGAQQAGLDTCWFNKYNEQRHEALPTYVIYHLEELLAVSR